MKTFMLFLSAQVTGWDGYLGCFGYCGYLVNGQRLNPVERSGIVTLCVHFPTCIVLREDKRPRNEVFRVSFPHGGGRVLWEVAPPICMCTYC
jgi:hypothetical protein